MSIGVDIQEIHIGSDMIMSGEGKRAFKTMLGKDRLISSAAETLWVCWSLFSMEDRKISVTVFMCISEDCSVVNFPCFV